MKNKRTEIKFTYEGIDYTLCYTANSLKKMGDKISSLNDLINIKKETQDFAISDFIKFVSVEQDLFSGAFIENHSNTSEELRQEILSKLSSTSGDNQIVVVLVQMLNEALTELTNGVKGQEKGNLEWRVES